MKKINGIFEQPIVPDVNGRTEWLETNNAGAYCSSTIIEQANRKYHGLLVTPIKGFEGRYHILSAINETAVDGSLKMGTNRYPDLQYPEGWKQLQKVELLPWPSWTYSANDYAIKKEVFMFDSEAAVWIAYTYSGSRPDIELDLKFLFTFRNSHELTSSNYSINNEIIKNKKGIKINPYHGLPAAEIEFSGDWLSEGSFFWDYNTCYDIEKERGHEWIEDRFVPGNVRISLLNNEVFFIRVGIEGEKVKFAADINEKYLQEKKIRLRKYSSSDTELEMLKKQSRHFLLKNPSGKKSINAGYPWFGEWGRDTMISLPGLTFYNNKKSEGIDILTDYISMIKDGLLPNTLGDTQGFTSYNSIDAGLLFCWAVNKMIDSGYGSTASEKNKLSRVFMPAVQSIINAFFDGRVPNAQLTDDGLISSGSKSTQLTWMDATAWGKPVTPRYGLAVELNALWYDALYLLNQLEKMNNTDPDPKVIELLNSLPEIYNDKFWLDEFGYLSDTVNEDGPDYKIRPNMLFASSARPGLLSIERCRSVVKVAEKNLLTDMGLRTLAPGDVDFIPEYTGSPDERDSKYHQGTVWPWPIGIMIESSLIAANDIDKKAKFWSIYIDNLLSQHLEKDGWGFVSEIFDGLYPGKGKGCFAQAWSCSEIIRAAGLVAEINRKTMNE